MKKLKQKIFNHYMLDGQKQTSENTLLKTLKLIQKSNQKSHAEILELATINATPILRITKLKKKHKKKKNASQKKEIPTYVSDYNFRKSWAWRHIIQTSKNNSNIFHHELKHEILLNSQHKGEAVALKNDLQKRALLNKKFSRYYRW